MLTMLKKAAKLEDEYAYFNLGLCYYYGIGLKKDLKKSLIWLFKAKAKGNQRALSFISNVQKEMEGEVK